MKQSEVIKKLSRELTDAILLIGNNSDSIKKILTCMQGLTKANVQMADRIQALEIRVLKLETRVNTIDRECGRNV